MAAVDEVADLEQMAVAVGAEDNLTDVDEAEEEAVHHVEDGREAPLTKGITLKRTGMAYRKSRDHR